MDVSSNAARAALSEIADLAAPFTGRHAGDGNDKRLTNGSQACSIKMLPARLHERAADFARDVNPVNLPLHLGAIGIEPQRLTLLTTKYWGATGRHLTVSFLESPPADLRKRIVHHLNAWSECASVSFTETSGVGDVRISLGEGGYWSFLGTDIKLVPPNQQTMNLEGFTMDTPDSEFHRVIRHEAGHTLGFPHEHMRQEIVRRIDPERAYDYFLRTQGWDRATVDQQVLTPLDSTSILGTPADQDSIMCYQLPGVITTDGQPIRGGVDINETDCAFAGKVYPKVGAVARQAAEAEWDPSEDILLPA